MGQSVESKNKALVLAAFDTLFNQRDYAKAEQYWSPNYIQHSAHIAPSRDGLFNLIKSLPASLRYEPGLIMAEGDFVMVHGRFRGEHRPVNWIGVDILRIADGVLVEHWDVLQDEATRAESKSGLPMFGNEFLA
ncbi:ester cyclase [Variovorax sp. J2P1-59]|uniref:nuclear transport factor 2 family protein n=1 Tax=Variovorax flavidus TaxID=3053501 RepID=UPI0025770134|nr:ester cyclase [Variovorax sp. J2P1-59]MDM0078420.1 ester cyclase [Variovorax sp. J2P1-59]